MTIARHMSALLPSAATSHDDSAFPVDLGIVCLWSLLGLMASGFFFAWSSGLDVASAMMAAG